MHRHRRTIGWLLAGTTVLATLALAPATADHPQTQVRFDHRGGNEWWVEVKVESVGEYDVDDVLARAENGDWHRLTLRSWGNYAGSFHVPPGERVQFQASKAGGMSDVYRETSCFFTHPAGVEQCDGGSTDPFTATFTNVKGNEWWVEAKVSANRPVTDVFVVLGQDGSSHRMTLRSWGAYATSVHIYPGQQVQFLAFNAGEEAESGCYEWPSATPVPCDGATGGTPPGGYPYDASFRNVRGNAWWVEADVHAMAGQTVTAVDARVNGGAWIALTKQSWGSWAKSIHAPAGSTVEFRARGLDSFGQPGEDVSGAYAWPPG